jgi:predicted kinase
VHKRERVEPLLLVVTGPPASGKSSIAEELARRLALPLIAKDPLKELLWDVLGEGDLEWSRRLGSAAFELQFHVARTLLDAGASLVLEGNFYAGEPFRGLPPARVVQIHVSALAEELARRYERRGDRHPVHMDPERADEVVEAARTGRHEPLDLPGELIRLDTRQALDLEGLAARLRSSLE